MLLEIYFNIPVISHKRFEPRVNLTEGTLVNYSDGHFVDGMNLLDMNA